MAESPTNVLNCVKTRISQEGNCCYSSKDRLVITRVVITDVSLSRMYNKKNKLKPKPKGRKVYRCFKNLDEKRLQNDIASAPLHVADIVDDIDDVCWAQEKLLTEIIDEHIPIRERKPRAVEAPFMNGPLRKEIN